MREAVLFPIRPNAARCNTLFAPSRTCLPTRTRAQARARVGHLFFSGALAAPLPPICARRFSRGIVVAQAEGRLVVWVQAAGMVYTRAYVARCRATAVYLPDITFGLAESSRLRHERLSCFSAGLRRARSCVSCAPAWQYCVCVRPASSQPAFWVRRAAMLSMRVYAAQGRASPVRLRGSTVCASASSQPAFWVRKAVILSMRAYAARGRA